MLHIIELEQFAEKDRLLIRAAMEDKEPVAFIPDEKYLRLAGIHPNTQMDREGEIHVPGFDTALTFKMSQMDGHWIMKVSPLENSEESRKIQTAIGRLREEEFPGYIKGIIMNVPEFFVDPAFMAWLNDDNLKFAQHPKGGDAGEWSEVILTIDPGLGGDGSECGDANFPEWCWEVVINEARRHLSPDTSGKYIYLVKLTNYTEE